MYVQWKGDNVYYESVPHSIYFPVFYEEFETISRDSSETLSEH